MKISFDYDGTLTVSKVAELAQVLVQQGHDIHIVTSREDPVVKHGNPDWNHDLFSTAYWIGIPFTNIHFTNLNPKVTFFKKDLTFEVHIDDELFELDDIRSCVTCKTFLIDFSKRDFDKLLDDFQKRGL